MSRVFVDGKHIAVTQEQLREIDAAAKKGESREEAAVRVLKLKPAAKKKGGK